MAKEKEQEKIKETKPVVEEKPPEKITAEPKEEKTVTMTQAKLDSAFTERKNRARSQLLEKYGLKSEDELDAKLKQLETIERDSMTELEKAQTDLKTETTAKETAETALVKERRDNTVITEATKLGFADPKDASKFIADDVENVAEALAKLSEDKPYLLGKEDAPKLKPRKPAGGVVQGESREQKLGRYGLK